MSLELNPSNIKYIVSGSVRGEMTVIIQNKSAWPYNYISQLSGPGFCEHGKVGLENHGLGGTRMEWSAGHSYSDRVEQLCDIHRSYKVQMYSVL